MWLRVSLSCKSLENGDTKYFCPVLLASAVEGCSRQNTGTDRSSAAVCFGGCLVFAGGVCVFCGGVWGVFFVVVVCFF